MMLEVIEKSKITIDSSNIYVSRGMKSDENFNLPVETFKVNKIYDADLLSYYFAGVREQLPISKFRCFYNVLEYLFEAAPIELNETARTERDQIHCVIKLVINDNDLSAFIRGEVSLSYMHDIQKDLVSNSGIKVTSLNLSSGKIISEVARWLYDIRCACMHSKKTYKGTMSARFVPYSSDEDLVAYAIPIIQKLAISCIEKDRELNT